MKAGALAFLAVRLMALWLFVTAVASAGGIATDWGEGATPPYWLAIVLILVVVPVGCGIALWRWAGRLSGYLTGGTPEGPSRALDLAAVHAVGVSLLGLWLAATVLPDLVQASTLYVAMQFARPPDIPRDEALDYRIWVYAQAGGARFASLLMQLTIGLALFLRAHTVVKIARLTIGGRDADASLPNTPREAGPERAAEQSDAAANTQDS